MKYVYARMEKEHKETLYRAYITDTLQVIAENTARFAGGKTISKRYVDFIRPDKYRGKTGNEVAADIIRRAGLKLK